MRERGVCGTGVGEWADSSRVGARPWVRGSPMLVREEGSSRVSPRDSRSTARSIPFSSRHEDCPGRHEGPHPPGTSRRVAGFPHSMVTLPATELHHAITPGLIMPPRSQYLPRTQPHVLTSWCPLLRYG